MIILTVTEWAATSVGGTDLPTDPVARSDPMLGRPTPPQPSRSGLAGSQMLPTHRLGARLTAWRIHQVAKTGNVKPFSD